MADSRPVVVGVDGSEDSTLAVRWASAFAARQVQPLLVVHTWYWPLYRVSLGPAPGAPEEGGLQHQAERVISDAMDVALRDHPDLEVTGQLETTSPTVALRRHSESASAVVVGSHGLGRLGSFLLGSVGVDLAGHTRCPLVVVRGQVDPNGPVVVGIDDSPLAVSAIEFAFEEAARRGATLRAVHAWPVPPLLPDLADQITLRLHEAQQFAVDALEDIVAPMRERHPDVKVEQVTPSGAAGRALVGASIGAQLVVVGARGRGGFTGLVLGSTSHAVIQHAECPVVVVPHPTPAPG